MTDEKKTPWGALIERGRLIWTDGNGKYTVESMDRPGIISLPMKTAGGTYQTGDRVYFAVFGDGSGIILTNMD